MLKAGSAFMGDRSEALLRANLWEVTVSIQGATHRRSLRAARFALAALSSLVAHAASLLALFIWYASPAGTPSASTDPESWNVNWVDLIPSSEARADGFTDDARPVLAEPSSAPATDGRPVVPESVAIPAQDRGQERGKPLPPAFRKDRSTLHAQLSNGARSYHPEHERTARVASTPQAERREPVVGQGDLSKAQGMQPGTAEAPTTGLASDERTAIEGARVAGQGPLATEQGERRFDVDRLGPGRDARWQPTRSDELRPGRMDLAAVSAPGPSDGQPGRGQGLSPGVVSRPTRGQAPSLVSQRGGGSGAGQGEDAQRALHELEIRRRIGQYLRFPHRLALMLEQGETIVSFVVNPSGQLVGGIHIVKSAGFVEFDDEAVAAVRRAAPFAPPGRALALSVRVPFQNPVVR
jgi:TonB family protein